MSKTIPIQPLSIEAFKPYGQAVMGAEGKPNYSGEGWASLFPAAATHLPQAKLGWVELIPTSKKIAITGMEREPEVEMIWTVDKPIIQTVALPGNLNNHAEQPHAEQVKAFLIKPGQVIAMHPGTWHYAAIPATDEKTLYYFVTKDHPREPGWEDVSWVPFVGDKSVVVET